MKYLEINNLTIFKDKYSPNSGCEICKERIGLSEWKALVCFSGRCKAFFHIGCLLNYVENKIAWANDEIEFRPYPWLSDARPNEFCTICFQYFSWIPFEEKFSFRNLYSINFVFHSSCVQKKLEKILPMQVLEKILQ